ncbi:acyltransferase family protein [Bacillus suaedaesalsae]|uniref:Acyltransferase family protein n=1 Tax=Bacillus suaedaesalsae TaxID=2810349 RepID=A0ABS2DJV9_9BACI|nr:acyltransferase family protein [Bacillus suaedaesalsae]MBM6618785.1 acyltransferase family protein [Bacillus suaedaesalsae]
MNKRDAYYDNAKFLLIFLVVFGHFIQSYVNDNKIVLTLYNTIYLFHMPAFILISGYFAKGFKKEGYLKSVAKKLILPYLVFQGIYSFFYYFIQGREVSSVNPLDPHWSLWFLISLFFWNVMLYGYTKLKPGYAIFIAITLGVLVGYVNEVNSFLSLSRTFVFFPLFLVGYFLNREQFKKIRETKIKIFSVSVLVVTFICFYFYTGFEHQWLFGSKPYVVLDAYGLTGALTRLGVYALSFLTTMSFLALVPSREMFFTKWGTRTLYVYLLHGFFIKSFRNSSLVNVLNESEQIIVMSIVSLILTILLSSDFIRTTTQPFIEMKISALKRWAERVQGDHGRLQNR